MCCEKSPSSKIRFLLLFTFLLIFISGLLPSQANARNTYKNVLILHSYHKGIPWTDNVEDGIESVLNPNDNIDLQVEYMDTKRIKDNQYLEQLYKTYKYKFRNRKFDAIISSDNSAFDFLQKHHKELFPDTPVFFCGVNFVSESLLKDNSLFTGVLEDIDVKDSLDLIVKLQPQTKQIVAIVSPEDETSMDYKRLLETLIPSYKNINFIFLEDNNINEIQRKVQDLSGNSAVLFLRTFNRDMSGSFIYGQKSIETITQNCKVPIYSIWDVYLGHGILGGKMSSGYNQGRMAAEIALRHLKGEKVSTIPLTYKSPNEYMFDYKIMKRFGIELSQLPEDSTIINRPFSFYHINKELAWSSVLGVLLLIVLSFLLFINILKRKRVENELINANEQLELKVEERTLELKKSNEKLQLEITEHKRTEEELQDTINELSKTKNVLRERKKLAIVGQMAAGMAHEIKNPLTAIRGLSQIIMKKYSVDKSLSDYMRVIVEEANQANNVITDFLQLAQPKPLNLKKESINKLIKSILAIISPQAFLKNVEVIYEENEDTPNIMIDPDQIKQVLLNMCHNSLEAITSQGTINITTGYLADKNEIFIDIQDTGYGIKTGDLENMGVPFYTTKADGIGLGLSICYSIIHAHKGQIEIDSKEGQGTRFRIYLPC